MNRSRYVKYVLKSSRNMIVYPIVVSISLKHFRMPDKTENLSSLNLRPKESISLEKSNQKPIYQVYFTQLVSHAISLKLFTLQIFDRWNVILIATGTWFSLVETKKGKCSENATTDLSDKFWSTWAKFNCRYLSQEQRFLCKIWNKSRERKNSLGKSYIINKSNAKFMLPSVASVICRSITIWWKFATAIYC